MYKSPTICCKNALQRSTGPNVTWVLSLHVYAQTEATETSVQEAWIWLPAMHSQHDKALLKYADYQADEHASDPQKVWLQLTASL